MSINIGMLLHQLPYILKTIFRKYENKCKSKINKIWFNQTCFNKVLFINERIRSLFNRRYKVRYFI